MKYLFFLSLLVICSFSVQAQTVNADTTLHGSVIFTPPDATSVSVLWTQISGPTCTIVSPTSAVTEVKGNAYGTYVFQLVGTDNLGKVSAPKQVTMTVISGQIPVVDAGINFTIKIGG